MSGHDTEPEDEDVSETPHRRGGKKLSPELQARVDAEAVTLGRFLPLGMVVGAVVGTIAGALTRRWGICIPVGVALGILVAGTLPLMRRR